MINLNKSFHILSYIAFCLFFVAKNSYCKNYQDYAVAKVNKNVITSFEVQDRYNFLVKFSQIKVNSEQEKKIVINQIIDKMIDEELIRQEGKKFNIVIAPEEIEAIVEAFAQKNKKSYKVFKSLFKKYNLSFNNFKEQIESDLIWSKIISSYLKSKIKISDQEVREFLEQNKQETKIIKFNISEIYIKKKDDSQIFINKLYDDLLNGADFENFVKQFSQSLTSESNGEIGWVSKKDIHLEIYKSLSDLEINSYTKPIFLNDGFYIFKLHDKKIEDNVDEDLKEYAKKRIFIQMLDVESKSYLINLRKKSFIEVYNFSF